MSKDLKSVLRKPITTSYVPIHQACPPRAFAKSFDDHSFSSIVAFGFHAGDGMRLKLLVHNVNGLPEPYAVLELALNKTAALQDIICEHHVVVLTETRTNEMDRLVCGLHAIRLIIHATSIAPELVGLPGHGVTVFREDAMLGATYVNPVSPHFFTQAVTDSFSTLLSEVAHATQMAPHELLCGDFNATFGRMSEISDMHDGILIAHPALQQARRSGCSATNAAGRQLVELANVSSCVLGTGRVLGDDGQRTCVGHARGQEGSRPDFVVMSDEVFRAAEQVDIAEVPHISNHCTLSMISQVSAAGLTNVDWELNSEHVCQPGGCGSRLVLNWQPECAEAYAQ
eukprot:1154669-Pelagomonas_calceolata.AAC.1